MPVLVHLESESYDIDSWVAKPSCQRWFSGAHGEVILANQKARQVDMGCAR